MTPKQWDRVSAIFERAVACDPHSRRRYVDETCGGDSALRAEVVALLDNDRADEFLEPPKASGGATPVDNQTDPLVGRRIGPYEIIRGIAEGGMGSVYLGARTEDYTSQVAIKLVRRGMDSELVLSRFRKEMQFQAVLGKHPNIAQMLDAGATEEGLPYYVMEYVEGERIDHWCDRHRLTLGRRLELFRDVCAAVQFAHQNTVIHRDLKPSNILVTEDGRPTLIDFGIAKLLDDAADASPPERTLTGMQVLTPEYASPEQVRGERLTTASDVYSLGVVLYELLTGRRPYHVDTRTPLQMARVISDVVPKKPSEAVAREGIIERGRSDTQTGALEQIAQARDTAPSRLTRGLRGDLDRIVLMALRKEPVRRYGSAEQLVDDIDRYLHGLPVRAQRDTWRYRARKFAVRNWALLAAGVLVLAAVVGGGAFSFTQWRRAEVEATLARAAAGQEAAARKVAQAARTEAERQTAKAQAAVDFLVEDIINAAHPGKLGYQVTVLESVEQSLDKIDTRFANQPQAAAAVHIMAASVLKSFGRQQAALDQFQLGYDLRHKHLGPDHRDTLEAQWGIGIANGGLARREESIPLLRDVLERCRAQFGEKDKLTVGVMEALGEELQAHGEYGEAESLLVEAMRRHDAVYPPNDPRRGYAMSSLTALYEAQNKLDKAETIARQELAFARRYSKRDDMIFIGSHTQLANVLYSQKKYAEAERLLVDLVDNLDEFMPEDDWRRGVVLSLYGCSLLGLGKLDEASPHMVRQYEIFRAGRGADDWLTERSLGQLRDFMYRHGKVDEALSYHLESLRTRLRIGGRDQGESILTAIGEYTASAQKFDRYPGDDKFFDALTKYGEQELPPDHAHRAQYLGNLGWALLQMEQYEQAEPLLLASYEERKETLVPYHGDLKWLLETIIELYTETARAAEVVRFQRALDGLTQK